MSLPNHITKKSLEVAKVLEELQLGDRLFVLANVMSASITPIALMNDRECPYPEAVWLIERSSQLTKDLCSNILGNSKTPELFDQIVRKHTKENQGCNQTGYFH